MKAMIGLLPIAAALLFAWIPGYGADKPKLKPKLTPVVRQSLRVGQEAHAWSRSGQPVYCTGDFESAKMVSDAIQSGDMTVVDRLKATNTAFTVPNETKVKIVDFVRTRGSITGAIKTKILEGENKGATAWFPWDSVKALEAKVAEVGTVVRVKRKSPKDQIIFAKGTNNYVGLVEALKRGDRSELHSNLQDKIVRLIQTDFTAIVTGSAHTRAGDALRVRIIGGPENGSEGWISAGIVSVVSTPQDGDAPSSPASALLVIAKQAEAVDRQAAIDYYREIISEFEDSKESAEARDRLAALKVRP